jgi:hypothetical protein
MRTELLKKENFRGIFTAVFERYGKKTGYRGQSEETLLFKEIKDPEGRTLADHLWFSMTKGFEKLGRLLPGDKIRFEARVKSYKKGWVNRKAAIDQSKRDYRLSFPTKITRFSTFG